MGLRSIIGFAGMTVVLVFGIKSAEAGHIQYFVDPPTLFIVAFGTLFFLMMNYSFSETRAMVRIALSRKTTPSRDEVAQAIHFFESGGRAALMFGVLAVFIGLILILMNLSSNPDALGPSMSIALMGIIYAVMIAELVFQPLRIQCVKKLAAREESPPATAPGGAAHSLLLSLMLILFGLLPMMIVMALLFG